MAPTAGIERRQLLSREEFFVCYKAGSRPVIIVDGMKDWPAMTRWTPDYLDQVCGDETVQVMAARDSDANYEIHSDAHRTVMRFGDYVAKIKAAGQTNDFYLVAQNEFMKTAGARRLYDDIVAFPDYLDDRRDGYVFLWFGPGGTVTPLHHDTADIILAQVHGRKRVTMIPATQNACVYNNIGVYSEVDCEQPDFIRHPFYRYADKFVFDLNPGEALFIPVGWWHHVRALDVSISVSFTNFFG
jgi:ribosomal protein L16 Arg81 hydroxylase